MADYVPKCIAERTLNPDTEQPEGQFRYQVRDILGLSWNVRDADIFAALRRLKKLEASQEVEGHDAT